MTDHAETERGADALLDALVEQGVEYIFANLGTDYPPLVEAFARARARGRPIPQVVLCPHETVAGSAAQGYAQVSGRPQAIFVHVDVGTANLGGTVHNFARSRTPVCIVAGQTPWTTRGELPGSRTSSIQYTQDVPDQTGIVRGYVKWAHELKTPHNLRQVVRRAFQVARAEPAGPVYLMAAREPLELPLPPALAEAGPDPRAGTLPPPTVADEAGLRTLAGWLAAAERPVCITGYMGRHPGAVAPLVALAERLSMPVLEVSLPYAMSFPRDHPLHLGVNPTAIVPRADEILVVDCDIPWIPSTTRPAAGAKIAHLDLDPVKPQMPLADIPADLRLAGDAGTSLHRLLDLLPADDTAAAERRRAWAGELRARADRTWAEALRPASGGLTPAVVADAVGRLLPETAIVLDEAVTNVSPTVSLTRRRLPGTYFGSGGSSLGWGLGAALGAKLAAPDRDVALVTGDGAYLFGAPSAAFWAARRYRAPWLTVIYNNVGWGAVKGATLDQHPEGFAARSGDFSASLAPSVDLGAVAAACGAHAERVDDPADLDAALRRALAAVRDDRAAVVDVSLPPV